MTTTSPSTFYARFTDPSPSALPRDTYLQMLRAALAVQEYSFAREAALSWLAAFPGDLQAGLIYAEALMGENHPRQAFPILRGLCQADPEFTEAAQDLLQAEIQLADLHDDREAYHPDNGQIPAGLKLAWANVVALRGRLASLEIDLNATPEARWSLLLRQARTALKQEEHEQAGQLIQQVLGLDALTPLASVTHLEVMAVDRYMPAQAKLSLADYYHRRWPDCLQCTLFFADWLMESGEADRAVTLLHQAAARDVGGQAVRRLWSAGNPYLELWPQRLQLPLKAQAPAAVTTFLGWNRLPQGARAVDILANRPVAGLSESPLIAAGEAGPALQASLEPDENETATPSSSHPDKAETSPDAATPLTLGDIAALNAEEPRGTGFVFGPEAGPQAEVMPQASTAKTRIGVRESLHPIQNELEKAAARLKRPGLMRLDGRFPVYVIFSVRQGLERQFGPQGADRVIAGMQDLAKTMQTRPGWGARLFLADKPECTTPLGIRPARPVDPWELKLSLVDLDAALARRGEMIGAVLIVGGPEVVPFHCLPNPVDDDDGDVPSDNPYATRDENYFVPEWPVGRLPGEAGSDPALILSALGRIQAWHAGQTRRLAWYKRWLNQAASSLGLNGGRKRRGLGYTAAIWKDASSFVYRPIGRPRGLLVSPPVGIDCANGRASNNKSKKESRLDLPNARFGYFNLHGLPDAADWYGQSDPTKASSGTDYPVALRPVDIGGTIGDKDGRAPEVVFSEACYGAHIQGKTSAEAIALKFLASGSQVVVGSTCMAYGSVASPLIAADLLGRQFWNLVSEGLPAGEALQRAKIRLAREMHSRQGYLDGEDQKTLISFVLYGDPLAQPVSPARLPKGIQRMAKPPSFVKTVCDRSEAGSSLDPAPPEVVASVKQVVARYLPGMAGAELSFSQERAQCGGRGHACPNRQLKSCSHPAHEPARRLVILSKQVKVAESTVTQYARLTLDVQGKLLKLVVSR